MTREEAIKELQEAHDIMRSYDIDSNESRLMTALNMAIKALEQEPCEDEYIKVPKKALKYRTAGMVAYNAEWLKNNFDIERAVICGVQETETEKVVKMRNATPEERESVDNYIKGISKPTGVNFWDLEQEPKTGHCKDCKHFEYDSVAKVDGIPLIIAHEICNRWGDGCKTREDGYCFLFKPQESEDKG